VAEDAVLEQAKAIESRRKAEASARRAPPAGAVYQLARSFGFVTNRNQVALLRQMEDKAWNPRASDGGTWPWHHERKAGASAEASGAGPGNLQNMCAATMWGHISCNSVSQTGIAVRRDVHGVDTAVVCRT